MKDINIHRIQLLVENMESNLKIWLPGMQVGTVGSMCWPLIIM